MATKFPSFNQGLAQDPTTRRIWYGKATAHDFESHDGMTEERLYQKRFATHFGQLAIIALWVAVIALGPNYFIIFQSISSFIVFKILLFIWTVGIFFHLFNGVRYLYWSFGVGMELKTINNSSYFVLLLTILSTIIVWITV